MIVQLLGTVYLGSNPFKNFMNRLSSTIETGCMSSGLMLDQLLPDDENPLQLRLLLV